MLTRRMLVQACLVAAAASCSSTSEQNRAAEARRIVPGRRVGDWVLGQSTSSDVLGENEAEGRARFAEEGVTFEFGQRGELTWVKVTNSVYRTVEGAGVGSTLAEIRRAFGVPLVAEIGTERSGLQGEAMQFSGISFLMDGPRVVAVVVR